MKNTSIAYLVISLVFLTGNEAIASSKVGSAEARISIFEERLVLLKKDIGRYPTMNEGLNALLVAPPGASNWRGPYVQYGQIPTDPWGHAYIYHYPAIYGDKDFDLYSLGANGQDDRGEKDDITNWQDTNQEYYGGLSKSGNILSYISAIFVFFLFVIFLVLMKRPSFTLLPRRFALTTSFFMLVTVLWPLFFSLLHNRINEISRIFIIVCLFGFSIVGTIISIISIKRGGSPAKAILFATINIIPILLLSGLWIYFKVR